MFVLILHVFSVMLQVAKPEVIIIILLQNVSSLVRITTCPLCDQR